MVRAVVGEVVGSYRLVAKLAEGGMGAVYRAEHTLLGKPAAVKVLLPELSTNREIVNRFFTEARATTAIRHPGIVEIFDFGYLASGAAYIVMELLDGEPLSLVLVARGRLTEQEALVYTRGIASALAAAHAQDIVHRDLKPDNIFLVRDPDMAGGLRPRILDFGIAKVAEAQRVGGASAKTRTGTVLGTPTYMSPEQCRGVGEVDHRSDLYSIGCILYEMLAGRPPFASEGIGELLAMHLYMAPPSPNEVPGIVVSHATERLVLQLLQKRPEDRVQSAADLARLLGQGSMPSIANAAAPTIAGAVMTTPSSPLPLPAPARAGLTGGGPAASASTTLSAAVGASVTGAELAVARRRSPRGFLYAGIGVVLAAVAAVAFVLSGGRGAPSSSTAASSPPPPPTPAAAAAPAAAPAPVAAPAPAPAPPAPAPPAPAPAAVPAAAPAATAPTTAAPATPTAPVRPAQRTNIYRGNKPDAKPAQGSPSPDVDRGD